MAPLNSPPPKKKKQATHLTNISAKQWKAGFSRTTLEVNLFIYQNTSPEHADPADQKIAKIAILSVRERNKGIHMQYKYGVKSSSF